MKKFNIIDVLIIAVILAGIAVFVFLRADNGAGDAEVKIATLELTEKHEGFWENVTVGDSVTEKVKKTRIGKVTGVWVEPCTKNSYDRETGAPIEVTIPERENVYITMEIDASADVRVGKLLSVVTKHFTGAGYVTGLEDVQ